MKSAITNVDEYITSFPEDIQQKLEQIRKTIQEAAPEATELISYGMPGYKLNKNLWYILPVIKAILDFMPHQAVIMNFQPNFQNTNREKDRYNSR